MRDLLRRALGGGPQNWDYEKVKNVKYIDDFISESLRLRPTVLEAGSRETPAGGIQIDEVHIPGNTNVLAPIYHIQRDPRYWKQAEDFIPERWGDRRVEMRTDKAPYFPFLFGMAALFDFRTLLTIIFRSLYMSWEECGQHELTHRAYEAYPEI